MNVERTDSPGGKDYRLTYVASPKKTYVVAPKGGEINYNLAHKDPLKFYDLVMTQDIVEHSAVNRRNGMGYVVKVDKRAVARILNAIERKLGKLINEQVAEQFKSNNERLDDAEFEQAFAD